MILGSIFLLGLLHGGIYASFMPPWGLLDEEQHLHYIQHLVEQQAIPLVGETYLSPEIIQSVFETGRHTTFHWPTPASRDPREMGLEGHSYEGYQPPLFYILAAPLYLMLPDDILIKLYGLRWGMVGLSLLTVWFAYRTAGELFPSQPLLVYFTCLLLILLPERAMSTGRINNDGLLEVIAAAFIWLCVRIMMNGLTSIRQSQLLGLLFGAGVLTKTSMLPALILLGWIFWSQRRVSNWSGHVLWGGGIAVLLVLPLFIRNLYLYGDLTGLAGFKVISNFTPPASSWANGLMAIQDMFRHFWVIWWKGSQVSSNLPLDIFYLILAGITGFSLATLISHLWRQFRSDQRGRDTTVYLMFICSLGIYIIAILRSYFSGEIPIIQGRFLLPIIIPMIILFNAGLWRTLPGQMMLVITIGLLTLINIVSLFGNLMPYFYFWSFFVGNNLPRLSLPAEWLTAWEIFYPRFLYDKPSGWRPLFIGLLLLYPTVWISTMSLLWHEYKDHWLKTSASKVVAA